MKPELRLFSMLCLLSFTLSACANFGVFKRNSGSTAADEEDSSSGSYYSDSDSKEKNSIDAMKRLKGPKKKILILGFWNDTPVGDESLGTFASDELKRELFLSKRVLFPEEKLVSSVTKDFVDGDRVQVAQLVREGRRFGVSSAMVGRISKIKFRQDREEVGVLREAETAVIVDVEMKVFDIGSGREISSYKRTGASTSTTRVVFDKDSLANREARNEISRQAIREAVLKLIPDALGSLDKMDWQGRIAKIMGNKVYINAGKASGILAGDILKVLSPGEEIVDPLTHAFLGRSEGFLKGTLEVSEFIGEDSAMATIHTGGNFQDGDVVRLY